MDEIFTEASGASGAALDGVRSLVENLIDANSRLDDVEIRSQSEIDRLSRVRDAAREQRRENVNAIECLQGLLAP